MERWTWAYVLQQALVGLGWCWALRALWGEVRWLMADLREDRQ
ncbi:MAG: hypothetical protein Q4A13_10820 [Fretibacterium sp.]|nr:hypothetical protein [Fretibacterium sp.]